MPAIADLDPDLILVHNAVEEDVLTQLRQIGVPLFVFTLRGGQRAKWETRVEEVAWALNLPDGPADLKKAFDERVQKIADEHGELAKSKTVGVISAFEENNFYVWGSANMPGTLLLPVGFKYSELSDKAVEGEKEPEATISNERLVEVYGDCDVIFLNTDLQEAVTPLLQAVMDSPLWQQLPAVKAGNVFPFGKATIAGYGDANYSLDRIEDALKKMKG